MNPRPADAAAKKLYVALEFKYHAFTIGAEAEANVAVLRCKPKIVESLPSGVIAGKFSKVLRETIFRDAVLAVYYHDCGNLTKKQVKQAVTSFCDYYDNYKNGYPVAEVNGTKPDNNIIIVNLSRAIHNVSHEPKEQQALSNEVTHNNFDACITKLLC